MGVFGAPKSLHLDEGGEWENDPWGDLCVDRRMKLIFQGAGAHPWISERRYNRLKADHFYTGMQILTEVQWRLNTFVSASGYSDGSLWLG